MRMPHLLGGILSHTHSTLYNLGLEYKRLQVNDVITMSATCKCTRHVCPCNGKTTDTRRIVI